MCMRINLTLSVVSFTIVFSAPVMAQDAPSSIRSDDVYASEYFDTYSPQTALDMLARIPGFFASQGQIKRGLGQGGANVLLNGERISGKASLAGQLGRIPAKNVVRIEIVDGASLDIPGLSGQVANVITRTSGFSGTWAWRPVFREHVAPSFEDIGVTISGGNEKLTYAAEFRNAVSRSGDRGPEVLTDTAGAIFEARQEASSSKSITPEIGIDVKWMPRPDHVGNFTTEYESGETLRNERSSRLARLPRGQSSETRFAFTQDKDVLSLGADYEFPLYGGRLKTIGFYKIADSNERSNSDVIPLNSPPAGSLFEREARETESILRTEFSLSPSAGRDWQLNLEGALNTLEINSNFSVLNTQGEFQPVIIPGANARVEEIRSEIGLTHSRKMSAKLDAQLSIGAEYSELSQSGGLTRDFIRPKGFVSLAYKPDENLTVDVKIEREIGQLSFFDFIASVDLEDDFENAGNISLVPSQSWVGNLSVERKFGTGNSLKATFYGEHFTDLVDRIPIGVRGDAVGNLDSATQYGVLFNTTLKGDDWGLKGTEISAEVNFRESNVTDPIEGFNRRLGGDLISYWNINFRHDIDETPWAYGAFLDQSSNSPTYRLDSIGQYTFDGPWAYVFVEHKDIAGLTVNAQLLNILGASDDFERTFFTDRRDIGDLDFLESREREIGLIFRLKVSGTF